jgi:hypothetical protein
MRRYISTHIEDPLAEQIIAGYGRSLSGAKIKVSENILFERQRATDGREKDIYSSNHPKKRKTPISYRA